MTQKTITYTQAQFDEKAQDLELKMRALHENCNSLLDVAAKEFTQMADTSASFIETAIKLEEITKKVQPQLNTLMLQITDLEKQRADLMSVLWEQKTPSLSLWIPDPMVCATTNFRTS